MSSLALVHLVRRANGPEPFDRFLASHREHDAGIEHRLVLLLKGFSDAAEATAYRRRAADLDADVVSVPDTGVDLTAYLAAARSLPDARLCFVNSFSRVRADGWLELLSRGLDEPGVGLVGASGSWGSHRAGALLMLRLPTGLGVSLQRAEMLMALRELGGDEQPRAIRRPLSVARDLLRSIALYPGFPAPHVRTNAFLIEREALLGLVPEEIPDKDAAYRLESGRRSLTARVLARGERALVAGLPGTLRDVEDWASADVFWQADQGDLLVADNQTDVYDRGSPAQRRALARYAWGPSARPV